MGKINVSINIQSSWLPENTLVHIAEIIFKHFELRKRFERAFRLNCVAMANKDPMITVSVYIESAEDETHEL